jgi:hypothetical protein
LRERVLTDRAVEHEQRLVRCAGQALRDHASNLLQLVHQAAAGVQSAGRVDDDDVDVARDGRIDRVERDGRRITPRSPADEVGAGALRPDAELIDRASAKRVGGADDDALALPSQQVRELADERRLSRPIHAEHEDHGRRVDRQSEGRLGVAGPQRRLDPAAQRLEKLVLCPNVSPLR